jgi:hypothetical protein
MPDEGRRKNGTEEQRNRRTRNRGRREKGISNVEQGIRNVEVVVICRAMAFLNGASNLPLLPLRQNISALYSPGVNELKTISAIQSIPQLVIKKIPPWKRRENIYSLL